MKRILLVFSSYNCFNKVSDTYWRLISEQKHSIILICAKDGDPVSQELKIEIQNALDGSPDAIFIESSVLKEEMLPEDFFVMHPEIIELNYSGLWSQLAYQVPS